MTYLVEFGHKLNQQELQEQLVLGNPTKFARNYFFELTPENIQKWRDKYNNIDVYMTPYRYYSQPIRDAVKEADFYLDFDCEGNIAKALAELKKVREIFKHTGCPENAIKQFFSGGKGFHLTIPFQSLGISPDASLHESFEVIARDLQKNQGIETLDTGIYASAQMFRMELSINSKTGLYKTPLYAYELNLSIEEIQALSQKPRTDFQYTQPELWKK